MPIYEVGEHEVRHYFSMGFVHGKGLDSSIRDNPLPSRDAAEYLQKIAAAIAYAHSQGVLHRDLKPSNVLIDEKNEPRITDFGLAKRVGSDSDLTASGQILGTPGYMPPEQALGEQAQLGPHSDIYSLGALLYALLTGRPPFQADNVINTLTQICTTEPVAPRLLNPAIDVDLEAITLKFLEKDPQKRYPSADDLSDELGRYLRNEPIQARPISRPAKAWRWCKRNPVVAGLLTAVFAVLVVGIAATSTMAVIAQHEKERADKQTEIAQTNAERLVDEVNKTKAEKLRADQQTELATERSEEAEVAKNNAVQAAKRESTLRHKTERLLYNSQMRLVAQAWKDGNVSSAEHYLRATPPDYRAWEYFHYLLQVRGPSQALEGHQSAVMGLAYSPGEIHHIAGVDKQGTLIVWDAISGKEINAVSLNRDALAIDYSVSGNEIAVGLSNGEIKILDAESGVLQDTWKFHNKSVDYLTFSPDGKQLASASSDNTIVIVDAHNGALLRRLETAGAAYSVAISPDSRHVAGAVGSRVNVWDIDGGRLEAEILASSSYAYTVAYTPDGSQLISGSHLGVLRFWDAQTGRFRGQLRAHSGPVIGLVFSQDGRTFTSASDNEIVQWSFPSRHRTQLLSTSIFPRARIATSPDAKYVVAVHEQKGVQVWATKKQAAVRVSDEYPVHTFAFSSNGTLAAGLDRFNGVVQIWDAQTWNRKLVVKTEVGKDWSFFLRSRVVFSSDSEQAWVINRRNSEGWNSLSGAKIVSRKTQTTIDQARRSWRSPEGRYVALQKALYYLEIWDLMRRERMVDVRLRDEISWVAFSSDSSRAAVGGNSKISVLDVRAGTIIRSCAATGQGDVIALSNDGRQVALREGNVLHILDTLTGKAEVKINSNLSPVVFSPDGSRLAIGGKGMTLWDPANGQEIVRFASQESAIDEIHFDAIGRDLVTVGDGHAIVFKSQRQE